MASTDGQPEVGASWHTLELEQVLEKLDSSEQGLAPAEAEGRLGRVGPNRLPQAEMAPFWRLFLHQFQSPFIYILAAAAAVALAIGDVTDALFILGVLLLNAGLGSVQEWRAERSSQALQRLIRTRASVIRQDEPREVDSEEVVPGDVIWLESGNRVPADARLISAHGLEVDESFLTGESLAVLKDSSWSGAAAAPLGDRLNMVFAGAIILRGRARAVAVETGLATVVGQLARDVAGAAAGKPPLMVRMERFARVVGTTVLIIAAVIVVIGVTAKGLGWAEMFLFAVALAVSAIPEGLPVAMTVALSVATVRMARRNVIVRKLAAVEGLGSCTMIATDKTGTLTCNELTVCRALLPDGTTIEVTGPGYVPEGQVLIEGRPVEPGSHPDLRELARAAVLCNEGRLHKADDGNGWTWRGDPTDVALLAFAHKLGWLREDTLERHPEVDRIPFEPEHRYAASFHEVDGTAEVLVKGAPERVMKMCGGDQETGLRLARELAEEGYRVLALARGPARLRPDEAPPEPAGLAFLGLVGLIDPPRPGVREAVRRCRQAGIQVVMVTGDHPVTALAIARDLDLAADPDEVITGAELLEARDADAIGERIDQTRVFARVAPDQKQAIVRAARERGHFVAVTGDGVNDAPALRDANIGVAMGRSGTDVAREAAELVITDDNFATIVDGVEEGRVAFDNVRKVIYLLISTGAAEVLLVGLSLLAGLPLPLLPVQILWLNLVTNGIQDVALAFEPKEREVLSRPPRPPRERIFNRLMIERTLSAALVMGSVGFGLFWWLLELGWSEEAARNSLLLLMVLFENVHVGNCRSETRSAFRLSPLTSPILLFGTMLAFAIHMASMHLPFMQHLLRAEPVSLTHFATLAGLALSVLVVIEIQKWTWRRRHGHHRAGLEGS